MVAVSAILTSLQKIRSVWEALVTDAREPSTREPRDVFRVELRVADREALSRLVREQLLDVGSVRVDPDSHALRADVFINETQIAALQEQGWELEVRENLSEVGRARQLEVGRGDRYEGGRLAPTGLGEKVPEE